MTITASDVNKLRQMTGAGMMDCKKALTEANGDFDAAIDILRKKGQKVSAARADRNTTEGAIFIHTNSTETEGFLVGLGCETDFVAKNDDFTRLGEALLNTAVAGNISTIDALLAASASDGRTMAEHITDMIGKIGEKIEVIAVHHLTGDRVATYLHSNKKVGVLLALEGNGAANAGDIGKDITMQIAAMKPIAVDKDDVDPTTIERELEIGKELARQEGKPEAMLDKIAQGRLNKFYKDNTLLNQDFVKDPSKTIKQLLESVSKDLKVKGFIRVGIG
jgi:elongation factor Ts